MNPDNAVRSAQLMWVDGSSIYEVMGLDMEWMLKENHMIDKCEGKDSTSFDPSSITQDLMSRVMWLGL